MPKLRGIAEETPRSHCTYGFCHRTPTSSSISPSSPFSNSLSRSSAPPIDRLPMMIFGQVRWFVRRARSALSATMSAAQSAGPSA